MNLEQKFKDALRAEKEKARKKAKEKTEKIKNNDPERWERIIRKKYLVHALKHKNKVNQQSIPTELDELRKRNNDLTMEIDKDGGISFGFGEKIARKPSASVRSPQHERMFGPEQGRQNI